MEQYYNECQMGNALALSRVEGGCGRRCRNATMVHGAMERSTALPWLPWLPWLWRPKFDEMHMQMSSVSCTRSPKWDEPRAAPSSLSLPPHDLSPLPILSSRRSFVTFREKNGHPADSGFPRCWLWVWVTIWLVFADDWRSSARRVLVEAAFPSLLFFFNRSFLLGAFRGLPEDFRQVI